MKPPIDPHSKVDHCCSGCIYWNNTGYKSVGECRRHTPKLVDRKKVSEKIKDLSAYGHSEFLPEEVNYSFPHTPSSLWCGEFSPR